ncbi:hypothetical protein OH76DRAFT_1096267 [Lentinus brumalis]|uniref:Uncharacterized protein n=1 Tax=Lentinus brumalis TaxID=2498619 RepID=A0A371CW58_9APHY|nr:hypothetical protein OH76DRAFT_1096267 [Polyporus brumalis]
MFGTQCSWMASCRFRAANLLLTGIIPGPKETNPDETQFYLRVIVNELLRLWRHGVDVVTPQHPHGRRMRVILVGVFCDKPAAHKVGGFASHSHNYFCMQDWIPQSLKATVAAFTRSAFPTRTDSQHREYMSQYQQCGTKAARDEFAKKYATRWSELARLPYFDMCRMIVVDPMHNLFLGLVKTHFYHIWVQLKIFRKNHELRRLHDVLKNLHLPPKLGRLPHLIGPLVIPTLWDACEPDPDGTRLRERRARIDALLQAQKEKKAAQKSNVDATTASSTGARQKGAKGKPSRKKNTDSSRLSSAPRRSSRSQRKSEKGKELVLDSDDEGAREVSEDEVWPSEVEDNTLPSAG